MTTSMGPHSARSIAATVTKDLDLSPALEARVVRWLAHPVDGEWARSELRKAYGAEWAVTIESRVLREMDR